MKNKIIAFFLFFFLMAPVTLTFIVLELRKSKIRKEVKHRLISITNYNDLVLLKFTAKEKAEKLTWEHSREFEYNGKMYDVVKTQTKGTNTYYWCWLDDEETTLNQQLSKLFAYACESDTKSQQHQNRLSKFFESLYFTISSQPQRLAVDDRPNPYFSYLNHYQYLMVSSPLTPPEQV